MTRAPRRNILLLALLLAVAAVVVWLATRPSAPAEPDAETGTEPPEIANANEPAAPTVLEATRGARAERSKPAPEAAPDEPTGQHLHVVVLDFDGQPRAGASVHVSIAKPAPTANEADAAPEDDKPAGISSSANGAGVCTFDLASLALNPDALLLGLEISAETFDRIPGTAHADIPKERRGAALATFLVEAEVHLTRGALVKGLVRDEAGAPIEGARVGAVLGGIEQGGTLAGARTARSAKDGTYTLAVPLDTQWVGLVGYVTGRRPAGLTAAIRPEGSSDVPPIILVPGEFIAGRVNGWRAAVSANRDHPAPTYLPVAKPVASPAATPAVKPAERPPTAAPTGAASLPRVRISWYGQKRSGEGAVWDGALIALCGPQPVIATIWPVVNDEGFFRAEGLERGPHRLRAETGGDLMTHPNALFAADVMADATSQAVTLSLERSTVRVQAQVIGGYGLEDEAVWVSMTDEAGTLSLGRPKDESAGTKPVRRTAQETEFRFIVRAGATVRVTATTVGADAVTREVQAPAPGESMSVLVNLMRRQGAVDKRAVETLDPAYPVEWRIPNGPRALVGTFGPDGMPVSVPFDLRDQDEHVLPAEVAELAEARVLRCPGRTPPTGPGALVSDIRPGAYKSRLGGDPFLYLFVALRVSPRVSVTDRQRNPNWKIEDGPLVRAEMLCR